MRWYSGSPGFNAFRGLYSAGLRSASCLFTSSIVRFLLPVLPLRNERQNFFSILSPKRPRLPRPAGRIWLGKYLLRVVRVGLLNSAAGGLPCLLLSLLSLLRCGAVCLALLRFNACLCYVCLCLRCAMVLCAPMPWAVVLCLILLLCAVYAVLICMQYNKPMLCPAIWVYRL